MNVSGKWATIFHNEKNGKTWINLSDSSKNIDGEYTNRSWNVRFKKGFEPTDRSKINFEGFFSYYKKDENTTYDTIQVMNWTYAEHSTAQYDTKHEIPDSLKKEEKVDPFFASSNIEVDDDDLPF
jgi:glutamate synthase domain-containing protein 2